MVKHFEKKQDTDSERNENFTDSVQKLIALVVRTSALPVEHATALCLRYYQAEGKSYHGSVNQTELKTALMDSDAVRQSLLRRVIALSDRSADKIWKTFASFEMYSLWHDRDVEALAEPGFTELVTTLKKKAAAHKATARPKKASRDKLELGESAKATLLAQVDSIRDGSNTNALAWIAGWLSRTNHNSRYGECDFSVFEQAAGQPLANAARAGLSAIWRLQAPKFKETETSSTYYSTVAGLQGLHLDLSEGSLLSTLSDAEVRQALSYARFEINGYPKWFWPIVRAHETVALDEFRRVLEASGAGEVSADKAGALIRHLAEAPPAVQRGLSAPAWKYATGPTRVDSYALESALACAVTDSSGVEQSTFEAEAWARIPSAFADVPPDPSDLESHVKDMTLLRSNAVVWGVFWLLRYPVTFRVKWESWRDSERLAAEEFMFYLAAYIGQDRQSRLREAAQRGMDGLKTLAALYEWVITIVQEKDDPTHEDGHAYNMGARDNAQSLRDSLLPAIASAKSQGAYEVLDGLRSKATGTRAKYIRSLQFQMREAEASVPPMEQRDYPRFERDFAPPVTGFVAFAQAVHNDLLAVKRDIETGEFSLRRLFNLVVMEHIKSDSEGLALEEDFQALLGNQLNHASGGRYVVTLEPILPAATRRDVLCQLGDLRATIELKMSERWTVTDYLVALEDQLKGKYMLAPNSKIGFFVIVLQRMKKWKNPAGGTVDFTGLIRLLEARALELRSAEPTLFLRIIGINAAPQAANNGTAEYADKAGNTWNGKGRQPKWVKDALAGGKLLADFVIDVP